MTRLKAGGFKALFSDYSDNITAYKMRDDPLTILQEAPIRIDLPRAVGKSVYLKPGRGGEGGHSVNNMVNAIENPVYT